MIDLLLYCSVDETDPLTTTISTPPSCAAVSSSPHTDRMLNSPSLSVSEQIPSEEGFLAASGTAAGGTTHSPLAAVSPVGECSWSCGRLAITGSTVITLDVGWEMQRLQWILLGFSGKIGF